MVVVSGRGIGKRCMTTFSIFCTGPTFRPHLYSRGPTQAAARSPQHVQTLTLTRDGSVSRSSTCARICGVEVFCSESLSAWHCGRLMALYQGLCARGRGRCRCTSGGTPRNLELINGVANQAP